VARDWASAWSASEFVNEFSTTFAPACARLRAIPKPIPDVDPVTIAVLPVSCMSHILLNSDPHQNMANLNKHYTFNGVRRIAANEKSACRSRRQVIEAGFIQARNLSSS